MWSTTPYPYKKNQAHKMSLVTTEVSPSPTSSPKYSTQFKQGTRKQQCPQIKAIYNSILLKGDQHLTPLSFCLKPWQKPRKEKELYWWPVWTSRRHLMYYPTTTSSENSNWQSDGGCSYTKMCSRFNNALLDCISMRYIS